jgi:MerR family transcriptional regulator, aldehyde-responsive regulator
VSHTRTLPPPPTSRPAITAGDPVQGAPVREYTIGEATELSGLSEHTLRYYERAGLLEPIRRQTSSRHRRYSADDVARLRTLACLRAAGMPLAQMRRYFELLAHGAAAAPLQLELLVAQREVLQARRRELDDHVRYLDGKVAYWQAVQSGDRASAAQIASRLSPCGQPAARPSSPRHP